MKLPADVTTLDELERWFIEITLVSLKGDKTATARQLGIDRRTLYRKLDAWGLSQKYRRPARSTDAPVVPIRAVE